jgi:hypothetical protein
MIDVKKLITGFLILAFAAVGSGLILSLVSNSFPTQKPSSAPQIAISGSNPVVKNTNAFLPTADQMNQVIAAFAPDLASSTMTVTSTDPTNLTDILATNFVNGVVDANPNGPTTNSPDGNPVISSPNINAIAASVSDASALQNIQTPDWSVEAKSIPVTVVASSPETLLSYGKIVTNTLGNHLNSQVQNIANNEANGVGASDMAYVESQLQGALRDTASVKTPAAAVAYQKSLLAYLVYQKNIIHLYTLAQTDPVKASLIFQREDPKFVAAREDLLNQAQALTSKTLSLQQTPKTQRGDILLSFVNNTFGIPEAHAMWPVFDPATWAMIGSEDLSQIGTQLENLAKSVLLQILKNTLMALVQKKVLTWVQGSGAPRFITNWGTTLINNAQTSAFNALNEKLASCDVYSGFAPQLSVTLKTFYYPGNAAKNACANQFAAALGSNSYQQFYNNFKNGGFVAFGASTLPSGNPYGSAFFTAQETDLAYRNAQAATSLKTQTSGGFKGGEKCDDGSDPNNGEHTVCENPDGADYTISGNEKCGDGDTSVVYANEGTCDDGTQPITTTPGAVTGFAVDTAAKGTTEQIAAANDIAGLLNSVMSSLLTSLASTAVNAAGQLVNQELTSVSGSNITDGATTPAPAPIPLVCNPSSQTIPSAAASGGPVATSTSTPTSTAPASLSATGGIVDSYGNPPQYFWSDTNGASGTGSLFFDTFVNPGTYIVTLTDSTGDAPKTCTVIQQ